MSDTLGNEPMSYGEAETIAAELVTLGYQARAYHLSHWPWTYRVVVTGTHGKAGRFRYVITSAAQLPKALDDLARGESGGSNTLEEGL